MGSEGPLPTVLHVTGFKKFHGVDENPTEVIARVLHEYLEKKGLPPSCRLGTISVLETAGDGAHCTLLTLLDSVLPAKPTNPSLDTPPPSPMDERIIWVHMGVNSAASRFAVERRAVNEATFRCPDEMGWQPQRIPIVAEDGDISQSRETDIAVAEVVDTLTKRGYNVTVSDDAGRFVCNYVYYHSLRHATSHGTKCLFVHVPPFSKIDASTQFEFMASLFEILASLC